MEGISAMQLNCPAYVGWLSTCVTTKRTSIIIKIKWLCMTFSCNESLCRIVVVKRVQYRFKYWKCCVKIPLWRITATISYIPAIQQTNAICTFFFFSMQKVWAAAELFVKRIATVVSLSELRLLSCSRSLNAFLRWLGEVDCIWNASNWMEVRHASKQICVVFVGAFCVLGTRCVGRGGSW